MLTWIITGLRNSVIEKYKAQDAGKGLEALSQMSGTISEYLAKREERKRKKILSKVICG